MIYFKLESPVQQHIPSTNGSKERYNFCLMQSLSHYTSANQKDWDEVLPALLFALNVFVRFKNQKEGDKQECVAIL